MVGDFVEKIHSSMPHGFKNSMIEGILTLAQELDEPIKIV